MRAGMNPHTGPVFPLVFREVNGESLNCCIASLAGPDPDDIFELRDEDFAVTDLAGLCLFLDGREYLVRNTVGHRHFNLYLRDEGNIILRATVELHMAFLPTESLHLGHGHALDPDCIKRVFYFV